MAKDLNITTISGRLGADPELRYTNNDKAVVNLRIASSRSYKSRGDDDWQEETTWVDVTAWEALAERINDNFGKGDRVIVTGRLRTESWKDKESGKNRNKLSILADNVQPMGDWKGTGNGSSRSKRDEGPDEEDMDELPF